MNYKSIKDRLDRIIEDTERIYLDFGRDYQNLLFEMEKSTSSPALLHYDDSLFQTIVEFLEGENRTYARLHLKDEALLGSIDTSIEDMIHLNEEIQGIKEDNEEINFYAMNAMLGALRARKSGGAFPIITGEFKKVSLSSVNLMDEIRAEGNKIVKKLHGFKLLVKDLKGLQKNLLESFGLNVLAGFENLKTASEHISRSIEALLVRSKEVVKPLYSIMDEIQHQDIFRQSIEQLIFSLSEMEENKLAGTGYQDRLDDLVFRKAMADMSFELLLEVQSRVKDNKKLFERCCWEIQDIIEALETDCGELMKNETSHLSRLMEESFSVVEGLVAQFSELSESRRGILSQNTLLTEDVKKVEGAFGSFEQSIKKYFNINFLSRMEVHKFPALKGMRIKVDQMRDLINRMETRAQAVPQLARRVCQINEEVQTEYEALFRRENSFFKEYESTMDGVMEKLKEHHGAIESSMKEVSLFTKGFLKDFERSSASIDELKILTTALGTTSESLKAESLKLGEEIESVLFTNGLAEWKVDEERLQRIIERFTIFQHKKTSGELIGLEVEQGEQAGVLTLF